MLTAICVGLLFWLIFIGWVVVKGNDRPEDVPSIFLLLVISVSFCVVIQHFGSLLIGAFT